MRSLIIKSLLIISFFSCSKEKDPAPEITDTNFNILYGGSQQDNAYAAIRNTDGTYILAGFTRSSNGDVTNYHGEGDAWVLKINKDGKLIWQKTFGGSGHDQAYGVLATKDGGYLFAGSTNSHDGDVSGNHGNYDAWVVKLDKIGNIQWQRCLGGSASDIAYSIVETTAGNIIVAGQTGSTDGDVIFNHGNIDAWVISLDQNGNKIWQKSFGGTGNEGTTWINKTSQGYLVLAGWTNSSDGDVIGYHAGWGLTLGNRDGWVLVIDNEGNLQWNKAYGGTKNEIFNSVISTTNNSYVVSGTATSHYDGDVGATQGVEDAWILNLNGQGVIQWQKTYGGSAADIAININATSDEGYIIAGHTASNNGDVSGNHGISDAWVLRLDNTGNKLWQRTFGGSGGYDVATIVFQRTPGDYVLAGYTDSNDGDLSGQRGGTDVWLMTFKNP